MRAIEYFPDTDTVYIKLRDGMIDGGEDAGEDLVIYYSADNVPMGMRSKMHQTTAIISKPRSG